MQIPGGGESNGKSSALGGQTEKKKTLRGGGIDIFWNHTMALNSLSDSEITDIGKLFSLELFFSWASLHNCKSYSFPCNGFSNITQITTLFRQVSS